MSVELLKNCIVLYKSALNMTIDQNNNILDTGVDKMKKNEENVDPESELETCGVLQTQESLADKSIEDSKSKSDSRMDLEENPLL